MSTLKCISACFKFYMQEAKNTFTLFFPFSFMKKMMNKWKTFCFQSRFCWEFLINISLVLWAFKKDLNLVERRLTRQHWRQHPTDQGRVIGLWLETGKILYFGRAETSTEETQVNSISISGMMESLESKSKRFLIKKLQQIQQHLPVLAEQTNCYFHIVLAQVPNEAEHKKISKPS